MNEKKEVFLRLINLIDDGYDLMEEYDSMTHQYGKMIMYQAESKVLQYIGQHEKTTLTAMAQVSGKTPSAYSQIIRKLKAKKLVEQIRNPENNREYILYLTPLGWNIFSEHEKFEQRCYERTLSYLDQFTKEELESYCRIQSKLNESFRLDVEESRNEYEEREKRKNNIV